MSAYTRSAAGVSAASVAVVDTTDGSIVTLGTHTRPFSGATKRLLDIISTGGFGAGTHPFIIENDLGLYTGAYMVISGAYDAANLRMDIPLAGAASMLAVWSDVAAGGHCIIVRGSGSANKWFTGVDLAGRAMFHIGEFGEIDRRPSQSTLPTAISGALRQIAHPLGWPTPAIANPLTGNKIPHGRTVSNRTTGSLLAASSSATNTYADAGSVLLPGLRKHGAANETELLVTASLDVSMASAANLAANPTLMVPIVSAGSTSLGTSDTNIPNSNTPIDPSWYDVPSGYTAQMRVVADFVSLTSGDSASCVLYNSTDATDVLRGTVVSTGKISERAVSAWLAVPSLLSKNCEFFVKNVTAARGAVRRIFLQVRYVPTSTAQGRVQLALRYNGADYDGPIVYVPANGAHVPVRGTFAISTVGVVTSSDAQLRFKCLDGQTASTDGTNDYGSVTVEEVLMQSDLVVARDAMARTTNDAPGWADSGNLWNGLAGTWTIQSSTIQQTGSGGTAGILELQGVAEADIDVTVTIKTGNNGGANYNPGIAIRLADSSNYWLARLNEGGGNTVQLVSIIGGAGVSNFTAAQTVTKGSTYVLRVVAKADAIKVYVDGVLRINQTGLPAALQTNTKFGLVADSTDVGPGTVGSAWSALTVARRVTAP